MKRFPVWIEGYAATGQRGQAQFIGTFPGETFRDACEAGCKKFFSDYSDGLFRRGEGRNPPSYWGCRMFDNHADAARAFG